MVGAWLKVNAASVALLVVAVGAGAAAVAVPSGDDGGGDSAFCTAAKDAFGGGITIEAIVAARDDGQLDTLISEAPDGATADNLRVLEQVFGGEGTADPATSQAAADDLSATLDSECGLDVAAPTTTTTTSPAATTTTPPTTARGTAPTTPGTTTAPTTTTTPPTTAAPPTT